jgi:chemotaxis protein MotB
VSAPGNRRRRSDAGGGHDDGGMERWLLTYADMITLLLALFIVLWSISSVNISKFSQLRASLHQAFSGKVVTGETSILSGGTSPLEPQGTQVPNVEPTAGKSTIVNLQASLHTQIAAAAAAQEVETLKHLKQQVDAYARTHGLDGRIQTSIDERGLVVRVLTDDVLFDSGSADLKSGSAPLLARISRLLTMHALTNPVRVEGNTDDQPISTGRFHSNWDLSAARATAVVDFLLAHGVPAKRLSLAGYADQRPVASNSTAAGRSLNRRVELVVIRQHSGA